MKILIDESLPRKLKAHLADFEASTVPEMGWAGKKNGELLGPMSGKFDAFLTMDRNLRHQQNLSEIQIAVVVLVGSDNRLETLTPLMEHVRRVLTTIEVGQVIAIQKV